MSDSAVSRITRDVVWKDTVCICKYIFVPYDISNIWYDISNIWQFAVQSWTKPRSTKSFSAPDSCFVSWTTDYVESTDTIGQRTQIHF